MKQYRFLFVLAAVLALAALACNGGSAPTAAPQPNNPPPNPPATSAPATDSPSATEAPTSSSGTLGNSSDLVTFTDENKLFSFELPGDWTHSKSFNEDDGVYVDRFESPDQNGFIENITGFSNDPLTGNSNGKIALYFLHKYYGMTKDKSDIRISDDSIQNDGSERLKWKSQTGGYSGISYFEVRGDDRKTFLMLTVWWNNSADQAVIDTITKAVESYSVP